jgi:hypothetical protein
MHLADGVDDLRWRHALQQEATGTCLERALDFHVSLESGQHHYASVDELGAQRDERVDAAHVGKAHVHQRDVGTKLPVLTDAVAAVGGLADQMHVRLGGDDAGDPLAQQRMIVNAENADAVILAHGSAHLSLTRVRRRRARMLSPRGETAAWCPGRRTG